MAKDLAGSVVLITGGGAGIGLATAEAFLGAGARVGVLDKEIARVPLGCEALEANLREDDAVAEVIAGFGASHGRIDVLVNNAGVSYPATVEDGPLSEWLEVLDINVLGYVRATRAALPFLRRSDHPAVVNMASCTAATGLRRRVLYSATKGAIEAMTRAMAADHVHEGIRVNCINPGTVDTPLIQALIEKAPDPAAQRRVYEERQPTGRMVGADEVAAAVMYLASPAARSTIGTVLTVDGGMASLRLYDS